MMSWWLARRVQIYNRKPTLRAGVWSLKDEDFQQAEGVYQKTLSSCIMGNVGSSVIQGTKSQDISAYAISIFVHSRSLSHESKYKNTYSNAD